VVERGKPESKDPFRHHEPLTSGRPFFSGRGFNR
jgi:hypothetical protein